MTRMKRWVAAATVGGALVFGAGAVLVAQQPGPPEDGKALAAQIGVTGETAAKLRPQLDRIADALGRRARVREQGTAVRSDLQAALSEVIPALSPEQRQQLRGVMMQGRGGPGWGMGYGYRMHRGGAWGRGPGNRGGPGGSMGYGVRGRAGYGMRGGMGYGMGYGMGGACPFYRGQGYGRPAPGTSPDSGSGN